MQSGFTVLTIIAFGTLTLALHTELLQGDRAALGLASLHRDLLDWRGFWSTRLTFRTRDWPKGAVFVVGHVLLTMLFP